MNWFQKHLNWTVVLAGAGGYFAFGITRIASDLVALMGWLATLAITFSVCGWALNRKNRSLAWLLLLFVPFGWIVFLGLENRSEWRLR